MSALNYHIILAISLVVWCIIHSALISIRAVALSTKLLKEHVRFYRLLYNLVAAITLLPILVLFYMTPKIVLFEWSGMLRIGQYVLLGSSLWLFIAGAKSYDGLQFLGIRQILSKRHNVGLSESGGLHTEGILRVTRHPWYLAGILLLWGRNLDSADMIVNVVFTAYLIIGATLEEKKLVKEFGDDYLEYKRTVSMLVPFKWMKRCSKNMFNC